MTAHFGISSYIPIGAVSLRSPGWITWLKVELPTSFRAMVVISTRLEMAAAVVLVVVGC